MAADVVVCTVEGVAREVLQRDLSITHQMSERDTARLVLRKLRTANFDEILVTVNGTARFGGVVLNSEEHGSPNGTNYYTEVDAVGWEYYLEGIYPTETYAAGTLLKAIVTGLTTAHLGPYGITVDPGMADGPAMLAQDYSKGDRSLLDIYRQLAKEAVWTFRISPAKVQIWGAAGSTAASWSVTDAVSNCIGDDDVGVKRSALQYANKVWVVAGDASSPIKVEAHDDAEIAAKGLREITVTAPWITSSSAASAFAAAYLTACKVELVEVSLVTRQHGTWPGQALAITLTPRGLTTASYLVQSVRDYLAPGRRMRYAVEASSLLQALAQWQDTFRGWGSGSSTAYTALVGTGGGGRATYPLGGSTFTAESNTDGVTYRTAPNAVPIMLAGADWAGRVVSARIWVKADKPGVGVTPVIWNLTTNAAASSTPEKKVGTTPQVQTLLVTVITGDNDYELRLAVDTPGEAGYAYGYIECQ